MIYDAIVIGGGLIGMLTARELAAERMRVCLLDKGRTGSEASWAGGGILSPLYPWAYDRSVNVLARWSQLHYEGLADSLIEESGIDPEYTKSGLLILSDIDSDKAIQWSRETSSVVRVVGKEEVRRSEPELVFNEEVALNMPDVAQIRNPRLAKAVRRAIDDKVKIFERMEVSSLCIEKGAVQGVLTTNGTKLSARTVIICAGAWSGLIAAEFSPVPDIQPVLGQMILFNYTAGTIGRIVLDGRNYVIPRRDGRVLVGSTLENVGFNKRTTQEAKDHLYEFAVRRFPVFEKGQVEAHWAGLRPGSPGGIPYIGPMPDVDGLYINAGHFRNGVVLAPASVRLLADLITHREPIVPPEPYEVARDRR